MTSADGAMRRIVVLGNSGAGKTHFARRLGAALGIDVHHLDFHHWQPGWQKPDPDDFAHLNRELIAGDAWVIEGNYSATRAVRLEAADTIIYLRERPWLCAWRFLWRCWTNRDRPDLPPGCREPYFSWDLVAHLRYILRHGRDKEPSLLAEIDRYRPGREAHLLDGRAEVEAFLRSIEYRPASAGGDPLETQQV